MHFLCRNLLYLKSPPPTWSIFFKQHPPFDSPPKRWSRMFWKNRRRIQRSFLIGFSPTLGKPNVKTKISRTLLGQFCVCCGFNLAGKFFHQVTGDDVYLGSTSLVAGTLEMAQVGWASSASGGRGNAEVEGNLSFWGNKKVVPIFSKAQWRC